jgi:hypothetical protein
MGAQTRTKTYSVQFDFYCVTLFREAGCGHDHKSTVWTLEPMLNLRKQKSRG